MQDKIDVASQTRPLKVVEGCLREAGYNETKQRFGLTEKLAELNLPPIQVLKSEMNIGEPDRETRYRPDDVIALVPRVTENEDGKDIEWWVINQSLTGETVKPNQRMTIKQVDKDGFEAFTTEWRKKDPRGVYRLEGRKYIFADDKPKEKVLVFENEETKENEGWAVVTENGRGVHLDWLQTMPSAENKGVGRAMMRKLKDRYSSIQLIVSSRHPTMDPVEAQDRLQQFYMSCGVADGHWAKPPRYISLDDKDTAGEWQKAGSEIGVDRFSLSIEELNTLFLRKYASDPDLRTRVDAETIQKIDQWAKSEAEMKQYRDEYNAIKKASVVTAA